MQDKLKRYKQLSAMADEDQTDEEVEEQVNLYYELSHPEEARAWAVYQSEEAIEPVKHCEWPDTGRDKDRYFGNAINPIQLNWW